MPSPIWKIQPLHESKQHQAYIHIVATIILLAATQQFNWNKEIHSAWSESTAARLRPQGGHGRGEKFGMGAFSTLERQDPYGQADIRVMVLCQGDKRGKWWGPKGWTKIWGGIFGAEHLKAKPVGLSITNDSAPLNFQIRYSYGGSDRLPSFSSLTS